MKPPGGPALLVMGHGSRSEAGVSQCRELARLVSRRAPDIEIGTGFIELASPSLDDAVDELVSRQVASIVAVPLVLLGAGHLKNDGPAALRRARGRHTGVRLSYGRDLGIHPLVLATAEERVHAALERLGTSPHGGASAVVLVGRGSTDPDANSDLYKVARLLSESRRLGPVEAAFVSLAPPGVPAALDRCRSLGASRVAVVPYFLFTGRLVERIGDQALAWCASHPPTRVVVGEVMGPDMRIADLVLERYREAVAGGAHMNCDCCIYRAPMPGHEWKAGVAIGADGGHRHLGSDHDQPAQGGQGPRATSRGQPPGQAHR